MTLVIMAAGMGSRFGGLKQIEPVGPNGEFIIDYSIYDAIKAGFTKVVFIIKKENYDIFKETRGKRIEGKIDDLNNNDLKSIIDILNVKKLNITDNIRKQVLNGAIIDNIYGENEVLFVLDNEAIALYKIYEKDEDKLKPYIMFKGGII